MAQITQEELLEHLPGYNETRNPNAHGLICHAPSAAMNFDQSGAVAACCYNRIYPLGRYPEKTLAEIWQSAEAELLRKAIRDQNLDRGCYNCKEQIVSNNYYSTLARYFDPPAEASAPHDLAAGPRILEFEISNICNLECVMCNGHFSSLIRKNREKLPPIANPYDDKFVQQLEIYWPHVQWAKFLGGEPFLNSLYFKIWERMAAVNPKINTVITTNTTIFTPKVESVLKTIKPLLVLSIDSIEKETYEKIRVNAEFAKTQENARRFFQYGLENDRAVDIAFCPMIHNWQEIPNIIRWGTLNSAIVNMNTVMSPEELSLKFIAKEKLREIVDFLKKEHEILAGETFARPHRAYVPRANQQKLGDLIRHFEFWIQGRG